jgi:predicted ATP-dependent endonuclease of OLD family
MEKIGIQITNYKNIKNQTFCFNPKLNCEYKEELIFPEKENYVNIFPKNINITAIVGKNGTGKSSILKAFLERIYVMDEDNDEDNEIIKKEVQVYENDEQEPYLTVYWDYSITDEAFLAYTPDINHSNFDAKRSYITLPSKVNTDAESQIDIHQDIQNLARNIIKLIINNHNIQDLIRDVFDIEKVIISCDEEITDLKKSSEKIEDYFNKFYYGFAEQDKKPNSFKYYEIFISDINQFNILENEDILIDFISKDTKKLLFLSFGEIQLLKILCNIQSLVNDITNENKNILFLLDEIELGLHPQWQKMIINLLSKITTKNDKKVYFVLTSHSSFILSDLPKENVIFLDKFDDETEKKYPKLETKGLENGNCINVSKHIELKTFGANIHTLLSNGFFMSDGLMGEFAKNKINEIKKFYELVKKCEKVINNSEKVKNTIKNIYQEYEPNFRNIQKIIGEPFLQTIIKNYLDELEILFNGKKEFLDKEIERLKELRKSLNDKA